MSNPISKNPLVLKIADGSANTELLEYLLGKNLAFTDEEYLESLVFVLPQKNYYDRALALLSQIARSVKENYVQKREANPQVAEFLLDEALRNDYLNMLALIIQNQHFPTEFLMRIAAQAKSVTLEILLENQVRLIAYPEILDKAELNPECSQFIRGKIGELREFYFGPQTVEAIPEKEVLDDLAKLSAQEQTPGRRARIVRGPANGHDGPATDQPHVDFPAHSPGIDRRQDRTADLDQGLQPHGAAGRDRKPEDGR